MLVDLLLLLNLKFLKRLESPFLFECESQSCGESAKPSIEQRLTEIATELGFSETPELTQIRGKLAPSQLIDESIEIIIDYQRAAEQVIEKGTDSEDPKSQIGLIVALAGIKHANGFVDYREDLNQAVKIGRASCRERV